MSGIKCSRVALNKRAELLLQVKRGKDTTLNEVEALTSRIASIESKVEKVQTKDATIANLLAEYRELLRKEVLNFKERVEELQEIQLPESISDVTIDWLE